MIKLLEGMLRQAAIEVAYCKPDARGVRLCEFSLDNKRARDIRAARQVLGLVV